jgi:hypothetical protein
VVFAELARVSSAVASTTKRNDKVGLVADTLRMSAAHEIEPAVAFLVGTTPLVGGNSCGHSALRRAVGRGCSGSR